MKKKRMVTLLVLVLLSILIQYSIAVVDMDGLNDDVLGLIVFKYGIVDTSNALESWNEDDDTPCNDINGWAHVKCDPVNKRVVSLDLSSLNLSGSLPTRGLYKLTFLISLVLSNNKFKGPIPVHLALLDSLQILNLSGNSLSGRIPPEFGRLPAIRAVDLSGNSLSGAIPDAIFNNSLLRYLDLSGNGLEGPIPSGLSQCGFLLKLNLSGNRLTGSVGNSVVSLTRLRFLDLSHNFLTGDLPENINGFMGNLKQLRLNSNGFTGQVPAGIGLCTHLSVLDLSRNSFTGPLPATMARLTSLSYLNVSSNGLTGDFPEFVGNLSNILTLDFSGNKLTGGLPDSLGGLKELQHFSAEDNELTGEIPAKIGDCRSLLEVRLGKNALIGPIPSQLFELGLEQLDVSSNGLTGPLPMGSTRLFETLRSLDLSNNRLSGDIPRDMALYFNLRYLNLSWNQLRSRLPPELGYFHNLSVLDLRNSALYGSIPRELCDSDSLSVLQLDGNSLSGRIPDDIGNCSSLYLLSLSHNNLNGSIPRTMSKLRKLKILKLEFNELSEEIPQELAELDNLLAVNISHNRLIGRLPMSRIFQSLDQSGIEGNLGICSPLLATPCTMNVPKPLVLDPNAYRNGHSGGDGGGDDDNINNINVGASSIEARHRRFLSVSAIVAIAAATVIVVGVGVVSLLNVSARRRLGSIENPLESMCSSSTKSSGGAVGRLVLFGPRSNLRSEDLAGGAEALLSKATEIGRGAYGTVYKATVGHDGRIVAVKKLVSSNMVQCHEDFEREVRIMGKARHPNLMPIKGYYWTPQLQLLISDYAQQGSLHSRLHQQKDSLPWQSRFKIALGTAKAISHLHHSFRPPIIHYNLKPSNILLDADLTPKISDFALARLLPTAHPPTSLGHVAPELACRSTRVTEKCDVYAFGVVVLELVTGKKAVEFGEEDVEVLVDWVRGMVEKGKGVECVDSKMDGVFPEDEVLPVMKLALVCASQIPSSRPSMAEVVQILQVIKTPVPERMEAF